MDKLIRHIFCVFSLSLVSFWAQAQTPYQLKIIGDSTNIFLNDWTPGGFSDSTLVKKAIIERVRSIREQGYLLANLDQLKFVENLAFVYVFIGDKIESITVTHTNLLDAEAKRFSIAQKDLPRNFDGGEVKLVQKKALKYFQTVGFPFSLIKLDSFKYKSPNLNCQIIVERGQKILFDTIKLTNPNIVKLDFLSKYLGILSEEPFNQQKLDQIEDRFRRLTFLKLVESPTVYFGLQRASVNLNFDERKVNVFDGIIGLVPGDGNRKADPNGELKLELKNLFRSGKSLDFQWRKITSGTQQLNVNYEHPFFLGSPLSFLFSFNQLKENTAFSNRTLYLGFSYTTSVDSRLSFFYENKNGNELNQQSSEAGDFSLNNYGLGFELNKLDNLELPKEGYLFRMNAQVGLKNISSDQVVGSGSVNSKSNQYEFNFDASHYNRMGKNSVLSLRFSSALIDNPNLFLNDLFRLGGLQSIRGFNENLFFASKYILGNLEWQWYIEPESYVFLFFDQSFLERETFSGSFNKHPSGLGIGMKINSNNGFFNLIYGLGNTNDNGFSFDQSKIHFGYIGRF